MISLSLYIYNYIYIYICMYVYISLSIYIYIKEQSTALHARLAPKSCWLSTGPVPMATWAGARHRS